MATQPSEEQGNSNHAKPAADIENDLTSVGSAASQSGGASEISEEEVDGHHYRPLLQSVLKGDWESATRFFEQDSASKTAKITSRSETLLHRAASEAPDQFLENLVQLLSPNPEALEMVDRDGRTALHNAVLRGRISMVKALVRSNPKLTQLADEEGRVPLRIAALEASMHKDIAWFLAKCTTDDGPSHPFSSPDAIMTLIYLTDAGHHDITLYLARRYPSILTMKKTEDGQGSFDILWALAMMESYFRSGTRLSVVEALIYRCIPVDLSYKPTDNSDPGLQCLTRSLWNTVKIVVPMIKRTYEVKMRHETSVELAERVCKAMSSMTETEIYEIFSETEEWGLKNPMAQATAKGNIEIVKLCIRYFPNLFWKPPRKSLITCAIEHRQERILNLFLKLTSTAELSLVEGPTWGDSVNMIRAAAASYHPSFDAKTIVAGAAFQMQREIQWYQAVQSYIIPSVRTAHFWNESNRGKSYWTIFVENHQNLLENGEKWIKDTTNSCMLVSTLIATVLFAAAFTIPGGNDSNTGVPLLLGQDSLLVFAISDSLGLFSSMTAILLFLAILTSRYEARDFLYSLPMKIIMGLVFLFLSMAFMLVAFAATLTILLDKRLEWVLIPIILLTFIPVALFLVLQLPLLYQMIKSTYGRSIFRPESKSIALGSEVSTSLATPND